MNIRRHGVALIVVGCVFWSFGGVLSKTVPWGAVSLTGLSRADCRGGARSFAQGFSPRQYAGHLDRRAGRDGDFDAVYLRQQAHQRRQRHRPAIRHAGGGNSL